MESLRRRLNIHATGPSQGSAPAGGTEPQPAPELPLPPPPCAWVPPSAAGARPTVTDPDPIAEAPPTGEGLTSPKMRMLVAALFTGDISPPPAPVPSGAGARSRPFSSPRGARRRRRGAPGGPREDAGSSPSLEQPISSATAAPCCSPWACAQCTARVNLVRFSLVVQSVPQFAPRRRNDGHQLRRVRSALATSRPRRRVVVFSRGGCPCQRRTWCPCSGPPPGISG